MTDAFGRHIKVVVDRALSDVSVLQNQYEKKYRLQPYAFSSYEIPNPKADENLNIHFRVDSDRSVGPDKLELKIFGASEETRFRFRKTAYAKISVHFGYTKDSMFQVFKGDLRSAFAVPEVGISPVIKIEAGSGARSRYAWFNRSYSKNVPLLSVLEDLVAAMDVDGTELSKVPKLLERNGLPNKIVHGMTMSGHAADQFARLMGSRGIEWHIYNDRLYIRKAGTAIRDAQTIPLLSPDTGLVGVPSVDGKNILTAECMIFPYIYPGRLVDVQSKFIGGRNPDTKASRARFKVTKATTEADMYGPAMIKIEGRKVQA